MNLEWVYEQSENESNYKFKYLDFRHQRNNSPCTTYILKTSADNDSIKEAMVLIPLEEHNITQVYFFSSFEIGSGEVLSILQDELSLYRMDLLSNLNHLIKQGQETKDFDLMNFKGEANTSMQLRSINQNKRIAMS